MKTSFWDIISKPNVICILYIVFSSGVQIVENAFDREVRISYIFYAIMLISLLIKIISDRKLSINLLIIESVLLFVSVSYLITYNTLNEENYSVVVSAITCILTAPLLFKYLDYSDFYGWRMIEWIFIVYLLINVGLYIVDGPSQRAIDDNVMRFYGASDNPNQFAILIFSLVLINFYGGGLRYNIINIISLLLILFSGSRLYLAMALVVVIFSTCKKIKLKTVNILFFVFALFGMGGAVLYKLFSSGLLDRLFLLGLDSNGRFYLYYSAIDAFIYSSFFEMLAGVSITDRYLTLTALTPTHSFAESSFFAMAILFGFFGIFMFLWYFITIFNLSRKISYKIISIFAFLSLALNDIILYPQGFVSITVAMIVLATDSRKNSLFYKCSER